MASWAKVFKYHADDSLKGLNYDPFYPSDSYSDAIIRCADIVMRKVATNSSVDDEDLFYLSLYWDPAAREVLSPEGSFAIKGGISTLDKNDMEDFFQRTEKYLGLSRGKTEAPETSAGYAGMIRNISIMELLYSRSISTYPFAFGIDNFNMEKTFNVLKGLLVHPDRRVRLQALYKLGLFGDKRSMEELKKIVVSTDDNVMKIRALYLLSMYRSKEASSFLASRIGAEEDPVIITAVINLIRKNPSVDLFRMLVNELCSSGDDFSRLLALIRTATLSIDTSDTAAVSEFASKCSDLIKKASDEKWMPDPNYRFDFTNSSGSNAPDEFQVNSRMVRREVIRDAGEIALAVCSDGEVRRKFLGKFSALLSGAKKGFDLMPAVNHHLRVFAVEALSLLPEGKKYLEALLTSGWDNDSVMQMALARYRRLYPEELLVLLREIHDSKLSPNLVSAGLNYLGRSGSDDVWAFMEEITGSYRQQLMEEEKFPIATSIYYLGIAGRGSGKQLERIIKAEARLRMTRESRVNAIGDGSPVAWIRPEQDSHLLRVAIEMIPRVEEKDKYTRLLLGLAKNRDRLLKRLAVKSLGEFDDRKTKKQLFSSLTDPDPWTRVLAYNSLEKITGVSRDVDWFFESLRNVSKLAREYEKSITSN